MDCVPHVVNDNSGKEPAAAGGFTGWTLGGVTGRGPKAEIRPQVDSLQLHVPATLRLGRPEKVAATVKQGSRTLPVRYLLGAVWSGSPGLRVGEASSERGSIPARDC